MRSATSAELQSKGKSKIMSKEECVARQESGIALEG
jgi:hypothetical protein